MTNFDFLKKLDNNLYEIITEAEKLYTSEFFEQCMGQTRRFGEQMCKSIFAEKRLVDGNFDDMIATLKDKATSAPEKEFVDDLYFLKKQGNISVHSATVKRDGVIALECLQRAFEAAINYAVYYKKGSKNILNKHYDIELLVTGKASLSEKYQQQKSKTKKTSKPQVKQSHSMKVSKPQQGTSLFWIFVGIASIISITLLAFMAITK